MGHWKKVRASGAGLSGSDLAGRAVALRVRVGAFVRTLSDKGIMWWCGPDTHGSKDDPRKRSGEGKGKEQPLVVRIWNSILSMCVMKLEVGDFIPR